MAGRLASQQSHRCRPCCGFSLLSVVGWGLERRSVRAVGRGLALGERRVEASPDDHREELGLPGFVDLGTFGRVDLDHEVSEAEPLGVGGCADDDVVDLHGRPDQIFAVKRCGHGGLSEVVVQDSKDQDDRNPSSQFSHVSLQGITSVHSDGSPICGLKSLA